MATDTTVNINKPHNRIIFGAPGTGKAHFSDVCDEFDKNGTGVFEE